MVVLLLLVFYLCLLVERNGASFYNSSLTDFSQCKVYYSRTGTVYKNFFEFSNEPRNPNLTLDFHFSVLAPSDGHILLAPSVNIESNDPVYEIVIGAGGNTFSDIRRKQKSAVEATVNVKGLLSALDIRSFWIHISKDGVIEVGKEGEELAFLSWADADLLPLKVFSFSTWHGVEAKWFFDCPRANNSTPTSQEIRKNLTVLEKLRRDLLSQYDPYVRPVSDVFDLTTVTMSLVTHSISLDEHKSTFEIKGYAKLSWQDEKLVWNSTEYGDLEELHVFRREIWQPDLILYNSVGDSRDILEDSMVIVKSNGEVHWRPAIHLKSWCDLSDEGQWPNDVHSCDILFSFLADFMNLQLQFNETASEVYHSYSNEWDIKQVEVAANSGWNDSSKKVEFDPPAVQLTFTIKRISTVYSAIFFTPFILVTASLLSVFWVSPFGSLKISIGAVQIMLSSIMLLTLDTVMPNRSKNIPYLVSIYIYTLIEGVLAILVSTIVINLSRNNNQNSTIPRFVTNILKSTPAKMLLCLPKTQNFEEYGQLTENFSRRKSNSNQQCLWILLGVAVDRIFFMLYCILFICIL